MKCRIALILIAFFTQLNVGICQRAGIKNTAQSVSHLTDDLKKPEANRFTKVVLAKNLDEPMQMEILQDGRVLFAERKGRLKVYDPTTKQVHIIAEIPVRHTFDGISAGGTNESEDGIQGVLLDPNFTQNHWIYLYYSPLKGAPRNVLSRFEWNGGMLNRESEKILLEILVDPSVCCHIGGGMAFETKGNLLLATGENGQTSGGFSTIDERPGHSNADAQKSSANTNDLRGKIIRIHPEPNGTYTIPEGNLFAVGTPETRPEIYVMGVRNPWRLSVDSKTSWLYWGEVGPNGANDLEERGPRAYDEFNQARKAGNFGYPYFVGDNKAYRRYDFASGKSGDKFDANHPVNHSPNNTGLVNLPPAQPAFIWYPYAVSDTFPKLGSGGMSAVGGPIYRRANFQKAKRPFPSYYEGKWFITDWVRGWIMVVTMDENGNYASMERFLPEVKQYGDIDMDFGPNGDLYVLEYGINVFKGSPESQLVKIEYNSGNRAPIVQASANKTAGAVPLKVQLSADGSKDDDLDPITYEWKITSQGKEIQTFKQANPTVTFSKPGIYKVALQVRDSHGAKNTKYMEIVAGNEPPVVKFDFKGANKSFYSPGKTINYSLMVSDKEDGSLSNNQINPSQISVSIDYPEGFNLSEIQQMRWDSNVPMKSVLANQLINKSDCQSCHSILLKSMGPSYSEIAKRYQGDVSAQNRLAKKIIAGGNGSWGDFMMPAHPALSETDANTIVKYILTIGEQIKAKSLPLTGAYKTDAPEGEKDKGFFVFRAAYTDRGTKLASVQTSEDKIILRNSLVPISRVDQYKGVEFNRQIFLDKSDVTATASGSYLGLNQIDLTGIKQVEFAASSISSASNHSGWNIEIRIDSPTGKLLGQTSNILSESYYLNQKGERVNAVLGPINEVHDIYFVLTNKNPTDKKEQIKVKDIKFIW